MTNEKIKAPGFEDIVFETRNKEYGAYNLRKKYNRNVLIALLIGLFIIITLVVAPYLSAKAGEGKKRSETQVEIQMQNIENPNELVAPPPPPPPPPAEMIQQAKYVPPVVVDSVKPEENTQLMTADQAQVEVKDQDVNLEVVEQVKEEVKEEEAEPEPFIVVEEMPMYPGGEVELLKYIFEHTQYPEVAKENNIQGKVVVRFCVTSKGSVNQATILKGVDDALNAEALRVVNSLPLFKPGKQGGKPVPVWYMVPINFTLK
ncbi:MAG: energy transducer TonB [Bacteroidia bacterium]|nr:energy transducer TonB [Bacteroidia bacterium]